MAHSHKTKPSSHSKSSTSRGLSSNKTKASTLSSKAGAGRSHPKKLTPRVTADSDSESEDSQSEKEKGRSESEEDRGSDLEEDNDDSHDRDNRSERSASEENHKRKHCNKKVRNTLSNVTTNKRPKTDSSLRPYKNAGRFIPRSISPFCNILQAFQIGLRIDEDTETEPDEQLDVIGEEEHLEGNFVYNAVMELTPELREQLEYYVVEHEIDLVQQMAVLLDIHARCARTDDVGTLRYTAMSYIPSVPNIPIISPTNRNKSDRGFAHLASGRLLCPCNMLDEFDQDRDKFCHDVRNGEIIISADDWPSFLYIENEYDPGEMDRGLLKGPFLLSCFRHIFTGPRTAMKVTPGLSTGKKSIADIYNMTCITSRNIAYTAVVARFVLNGQEEWSAEDGNFNAIEFFNNIVHLFDDPEWSASTLEWWDNQVLGVRARRGGTHTSRRPNAKSGIATLAAQRAA